METIGLPIRAHQLRGEMKHQAGFRQAGVQALTSLRFGNQGSRICQTTP